MYKRQLKDWAVENGLELSQTIAMGDVANDLPMIKTAGIGIAFCAKPIVREQAPYPVSYTHLDVYKRQSLHNRAFDLSPFS